MYVPLQATVLPGGGFSQPHVPRPTRCRVILPAIGAFTPTSDTRVPAMVASCASAWNATGSTHSARMAHREATACNRATAPPDPGSRSARARGSGDRARGAVWRRLEAAGRPQRLRNAPPDRARPGSASLSCRGVKDRKLRDRRLIFPSPLSPQAGSAPMRHSRDVRSTSSHVAPRASSLRLAVITRNSRQASRRSMRSMLGLRSGGRDVLMR